MTRDILKEAKAAPSKATLDSQRESILLLRKKGYSWREVATFLSERGVETDHTAVFRLIKGRRPMTTVDVHANYSQIRELVQSVGGDMNWLPGGGHGGGTWELTLHGRSRKVRVRDNRVNDLDDLYESKVANPKTWDDYETPAPLRPDAFWRLVGLFK